MKLSEQVLNLMEAQLKGDFILDAEKSHKVTDAETGKLIMVLPRYAVWGDKGRGKPEVIETMDDLKKLQNKYDIPDDKVFKIKDLK